MSEAGAPSGIDALTMREQIEVGMRFVVPLVQDLRAILGDEVVIGALEERVRRGREAPVPDTGAATDLSGMEAGMEVYADGGALDFEVIASSADTFDVNVTQCGYADMMEAMGAREIGHLLVCGLDFEMARRAGMELERSQTRMQGASHCDFRYRPAARKRETT